MVACYNIVIAGKTGVGKSSLINYLYGEQVQKTGTGKPVTEIGFHPIDFILNDKPVCLFDSWGLEANKSEQWMKMLKDELKQRDVKAPVDQWFHLVIYCIHAGGHRVEKFELDIINNFLKEGYQVIVVITKSDQSNSQQLEELKTAIQFGVDEAVPIISACSESKVFYGGKISKICGKEEIFEQSYRAFWKTIENRLPERCIQLIFDQIDEWHSKQRYFIRENTGIWNVVENQNHLHSRAEVFINLLQKEIIPSIISNEISQTIAVYRLVITTLSRASDLGYNSQFSNEIGISHGDKDDYIGIVIAFILLPLLGLFVAKERNIDNLLELTNNFVSKVKNQVEDQRALITCSISTICQNAVANPV